jgi:hypothetical protein
MKTFKFLTKRIPLITTRDCLRDQTVCFYSIHNQPEILMFAQIQKVLHISCVFNALYYSVLVVNQRTRSDTKRAQAVIVLAK